MLTERRVQSQRSSFRVLILCFDHLVLNSTRLDPSLRKHVQAGTCTLQPDAHFHLVDSGFFPSLCRNGEHRQTRKAAFPLCHYGEHRDFCCLLCSIDQGDVIQVCIFNKSSKQTETNQRPASDTCNWTQANHRSVRAENLTLKQLYTHP